MCVIAISGEGRGHKQMGARPSSQNYPDSNICSRSPSADISGSPAAPSMKAVGGILYRKEQVRDADFGGVWNARSSRIVTSQFWQRKMLLCVCNSLSGALLKWLWWYVQSANGRFPHPAHRMEEHKYPNEHPRQLLALLDCYFVLKKSISSDFMCLTAQNANINAPFANRK